VGEGLNFLDHRSSKLGKLQAPKARSCDCRRQEAPYILGGRALPIALFYSGEAYDSSPEGSGAEPHKPTRF